MIKSDVKVTAQSNNVIYVKRLAVIAVFIALSAVGSLIKIPSPVGTIGLDSAPGFFIALGFGFLEGGMVIGIGHLLTAAVVGFPLSLPIHLFIAFQMFAWAVVFRWVNNRIGLITAIISTVFLNGVVSSFTMWFAGGMGAVLGVMPFLVVGSAINVILAALTYKAIQKSNLL